MLGVWSFWTKPFAAYYHKMWLSEQHHLLSWVLSVETARKHYPRTSLVTDDAGARLLVDELGLEFDYVSTELNALDNHDAGFWALGKLYAYRLQTEPFVHIDNDAFIWKPLPFQLTSAPVFAQNPELFGSESTYFPERLECALSQEGSLWLPAEWVWYRAAGVKQRGECCGILGGQNVEFINHYARQAIRLIEHPDNQAGWANLNLTRQNTLVEQYMLSACIEFHGVEIKYLFPSVWDAFDPAHTRQTGFTHLVVDSKRHPEIAARVEQRIKRDYPEHYRRCRKYVTPKALASFSPAVGAERQPWELIHK